MKHLIHIGFPKAASTFLQQWFAQHPELQYNHGALASFYNVYQISQTAAQTENSNYKYFVTSDESLVFPKPSTGGYAIENGLGESASLPYPAPQKRVCETLKDIYPNSQILLITRGFKGFILSGYSQYVRAGGVLTLENMLQKSRQDKTSQDAIDYNYIYNLYSDAFGEENLIVLPFELLRDDKKKFISVIENRLGLEHFEDSIGRVNESLSSAELYWYPRISHRVSKVAQKLGSAGYAKFYAWYIRQTMNSRLKKPAQALSRWRKIDNHDESMIPAIFLEQCRGKATVFMNNPLYAPYLSEYFLDE